MRELLNFFRPHVASENVERLLEELKKSLSGVKTLLSSKFNKSSNDSKRKRRKKASKRKTSKDRKEVQAGDSDDREDGEPPAKKVCRETSTTADNALLIATCEATQSATDESADISAQIGASASATAPQSVQDNNKIIINGKRAQLVVGTNAVTRSLEEGSLRVGVVCLTAKPALVHQHLLQLAASRRVPMAALPNLSPTIAPLLGVKSSLAIGIKVCENYIPYKYIILLKILRRNHSYDLALPMQNT